MIFLRWGGTHEDLVQQSAHRRYPFSAFPCLTVLQSLTFNNWGSEFLFATENILFSHTPLLFSAPNPFSFLPSLFFNSLCFFFFSQFWSTVAQPHVQDRLSPGLLQQPSPWPPSLHLAPVLLSTQVFFHNLNQTLVLLCATHSSGFSSLWELNARMCVTSLRNDKEEPTQMIQMIPGLDASLTSICFNQTKERSAREENSVAI